MENDICLFSLSNVFEKDIIVGSFGFFLYDVYVVHLSFSFESFMSPVVLGFLSLSTGGVDRSLVFALLD